MRAWCLITCVNLRRLYVALPARRPIEVRQNGYLIQSQTVAPGAFALTDLPVTGSGSDLQVTVLESDGTAQVFTVPFTTPAIALREGYLKYNVTAVSTVHRMMRLSRHRWDR